MVSNRIKTDGLPEAGREYIEGTYLLHDWMLRVHLLKELSHGNMEPLLIKHVLEAFEQ